MTEELVADKVSKYPLVIVGFLLIAVVVIFTLYLQAIGRFDVMANLQEIWFWVANAFITLAIALIVKGLYIGKNTRIAKQDQPVAVPPSTSSVEIVANRTTTELNTSTGMYKQEITHPLVPSTYKEIDETHDIEAYEYSELVAKYPWGTLLAQAKQEIVVLGLTCESVSRHTDLLKQLLQANKDLRITCALVENDILADLQKEKQWKGLAEAAKSSEQRLEAVKDQMSKGEQIRFEVRFYDDCPPFNMVALDPYADNAYMQIGYYPTGIDQNYRITNVFHKKSRTILFQKYWNEYLNYIKTISSSGF
ncbi:MAG: hypothetical protein ABSA92_14715 [Candidatus Bathyarchaeia archaeon]